MSTPFKLQSNWPKPSIKRTPRPRKFPVEDMKVGNMFFVPARNARSVSAYISRITKGLPGVYSVRPCWGIQSTTGEWVQADEGDRSAVAGVGVWRDQ